MGVSPISQTLRITVVDCDHDSMAPETDIARAHGIELCIAQCYSEQDVISAALTADGILVQYAPITQAVFDGLPRLRAVGRYGVGVDTVDVGAATKRGIAVCNVPDYGTEDVSDHAIALAMAVVRGITQLDRQIRAGGYDYSAARPLNRTRNLVFGVLGLGRIGSVTARKAAGIGFEVIGYDPLRSAGAAQTEGLRVVSFEELLRKADVISIHVPLQEGTRHLIDADTIGRMKPGSIIINTARGGIVDTAALCDALSSGHLAGAGLDVFEEEPLPAGSPLRDHSRVVLTPHVSWYSEQSFGELKSRTIENVVNVLQGRRPGDILNPEVLL